MYTLGVGGGGRGGGGTDGKGVSSVANFLFLKIIFFALIVTNF